MNDLRFRLLFHLDDKKEISEKTILKLVAKIVKFGKFCATFSYISPRNTKVHTDLPTSQAIFPAFYMLAIVYTNLSYVLSGCCILFPA